jgi:phosphinothricin acetyltransferase
MAGPTVRMASPDDADAMLAIYAPVVHGSATTFEYDPPSAVDFAGRVETVTARWPWLVAERDDRVLAYAYGTTWRARAPIAGVETTVYVHADFRRQGLGRRVYAALLACLRLQGYRLALGCITLPNAGSVGLHEALGFHLAGTHRRCGWKLGRWHDVGFWELELAPRHDDAGRSIRRRPATSSRARLGQPRSCGDRP